jgi:lysophospholipase L1-like esterase
MGDRFIIFLRGLTGVAASVLLSSCGSKTPTTPTPTTDPPMIACPASTTATSTDGNPVPVSYSAPTVSAGQPPLTVACTPVSGATFPVGPTNVSCTVTDAIKRTAPCSFTVTVVVPPKLSATSFVAFGDSITWGENGKNASVQGFPLLHPAVQFPISETYPDVLKQQLAARYTTQSFIVDNAGSSGESVTDSGTRSRFSQTIAGGRYQVVLLMEGVNDLEQRDSRVYPAVIAGLRQMILDAKSRQMQVFLATIPPENQSAPCCRNLSWSLVAPLDDQIRGLASEQAVPLVDVYQALDTDINTYIGPDGLHPTAAGYAKIADTFFTMITQTLEIKPTMTSSRTGPLRPRSGSVAAPTTSAQPPRPAVRKPR